jgi:hypothetical protein
MRQTDLLPEAVYFQALQQIQKVFQMKWLPHNPVAPALQATRQPPFHQIQQMDSLP